MKRLLLLNILILFFTAKAAIAGPGSFLTRWVTNNGNITIPVNNSGASYIYNITWTNLTNAGVGNGSVTGHVGNYTITGLTNGNTYQIEITGNFPGFYFGNGLETDKIRSIERWGEVVWTSMTRAFEGCRNMTCNATDYPDVSLVTNMSYAFYGCSLFNAADLNDWDVDQVTTMRYMFLNASTFNGNIGNWNVSNVTDMVSMFSGAAAFNRDLNNWDVSKVTNMAGMFSSADVFNGNITNWNVGNVNNMSNMFSRATVFNQDIGAWNVGNVTNMSEMFLFASAFNQNLNNWNVSKVTNMSDMFNKARAFNGNISSWDVSKVITMAGMFAQADDFNGNISGWNVSNVMDMSAMFSRATSFNQDLNNWDVSKVTNLNGTFAFAESFNQNLNNWNVGNVTQMESTFREATDFNGNVSTWNVTKVTTMYGMFGNTAFNGDLSSWNVGNVTDMTGMFSGAEVFNQNISSWNVSKVTTMQSMFSNAKAFNQPLNTWNVSNVTDMRNMFQGASLFNQDLNTWNTSKVTRMDMMFYGASAFNQDLNNWDVSKVTNMTYMFHSANSFNSNISTWNVSSVTDMSYMFQETNSFNSNIGSWNVSNVTTMRAMFAETLAFNQNLNSWDVSKVTRTDYMFVDAVSFNQELNNWNVGAVTRMDAMFYGASTFNQSLSNWNVANVTRMDYMFNAATSFNQDLSAWNMSNITRTDRMFENATVFNQDISTWNVSKITNMSNMFTNAIAFNQNLDKWNISNVTTMSAMLNGTAISIANYDAILQGWATLDAGETKIPTNVQLGAVGLFYTTTGQVPRTSLDITQSWTITGDALVGGPGLPTITGFNPTSGVVGATVVITGTNFSATPANNTVNFNGTAATVSASTATSITTTVPADATTGKITVTVAGNTATSGADFVVLCGLVPTITSFSPSSGITGSTVVITGTNFSTTPEENIVDFNGTESVVTASTATSITTTVPTGATGTGPISVAVSCNSATSSTDFTVLCGLTPTITSFSPSSGTTGTTVIITGTNFSTIPQQNIVEFNGTKAVVSASTPTSITTTVPMGASGTAPISVEVGCETTTSSTDFTIICSAPPTITSFSPSSATRGTTVIITGTNFSSIPDENVVKFNGRTATVTASTTTSLTTTVPSGASGAGPISVAIGCHTTTSSDDFTVLCNPEPTITSFSPLSATIGSTVIIIGTNFSTTPEDNIVEFNGIASVVTASTTTSVTATVPDGATGTGPISISVGCHTATSSGNFSVICSPVPVITSFSPSSGPAGTSVTITGANFSPTPTDNLVKFNGVSAVVTTATSTSITAEVPAGATPGPVSIELDCHFITSTTDFDVVAIITITTHPEDVAVCEGSIAIFSADATGAGNITYQWQFSPDGVVPFSDIVNSGPYAGATTAMLSVNTSGIIGAGHYRCSIAGDLATSVVTDERELSVGATPAAPGGSSASRCDSGSVTLEATGAADGQYKWYAVPSLGTPIEGEVNSAYTTPVLSATTTYYVTIVNGDCESPRTPVTATITLSPPSPGTGDASACPGSTLALTATGGINGQYKWYSEETGGTAFPGEVNDHYTTPELTATTTYYVSVTDNGCESPRAAATATILTSGCAPQITATPLTTEPGGKIILDLKPLITTSGALDMNTIKVKIAPPSGALASIENGILTIDYTGKPFSGNESITIEACNTNGICSQQDFDIEVVGNIIVYNAVSPNGDDKNQVFLLQFIDLLPTTKTNKVIIYNRWGDEVFSVTDYNNTTRVFAGLTNDGNALPSGIYFYKIILPIQETTMTGFLDLRY